MSDYIHIRDYNEAKQKYENLKPVKGGVKEDVGVPLRTNRRNWDTESLRQDSHGNMYIQHHNTRVLIFHKDNETITIATIYNSKTTNQLVSRYLPRGFGATSKFGWPVITTPEGLHYVCDNPISIHKSKGLLNETLTQMCVEKLDRAKVAAIRKEASNFLKYAKTMCSYDLFFTTLEPMKNSDEPFAREFYNCSRKWFANKICFDNLKHRYLLDKYREAGAYYDEDLPIGTIHKNMEIKSF